MCGDQKINMFLTQLDPKVQNRNNSNYLQVVDARINKDNWYLDSGCSSHMTKDASIFIHLNYEDGGMVTFGNNNEARIICKGTIGKIGTCQ